MTDREILQGVKDHMSLWSKALQRMEQKLSTPSYDTWLKNTILLPFDESTDTLMIGTGSEFERNWLEANYAEMISEALFDITGKRYQLQFVVHAECSPRDEVNQRTEKQTAYHTESKEQFDKLDYRIRMLEADYYFFHRKLADVEREIHHLKQTKQ